eukprot:353067-Chlamydomonas_euryale.AAC.2
MVWCGVGRRGGGAGDGRGRMTAHPRSEHSSDSDNGSVASHRPSAAATVAVAFVTIGPPPHPTPARPPPVHSLVFGEGVINDATSVVLLGAVSSVFPPEEGATAPPRPLFAAPPGGAPPSSAGPGGFAAGSGVVGSFLYLFCLSVVLGAAMGGVIVWLLVFCQRSGMSASKTCGCSAAGADTERRHVTHAVACVAF